MLSVEEIDAEMFAVVDENGEPVRSYPSKAAAWDHAVWAPLNAAGLMPVVGPGGMFKAKGSGRAAGWTSDPRQAVTIPTEDAQVGEYEAARKAAALFIQAQIQEKPEDTFMSDAEKIEQVEADMPENEAESEPESPAGGSAGEGTGDKREALREALSDSDRNAYDNFTFMAENAPNESARAHWQSLAETVLLVDRANAPAEK